MSMEQANMYIAIIMSVYGVTVTVILFVTICSLRKKYERKLKLLNAHKCKNYPDTNVSGIQNLNVNSIDTKLKLSSGQTSVTDEVERRMNLKKTYSAPVCLQKRLQCERNSREAIEYHHYETILESLRQTLQASNNSNIYEKLCMELENTIRNSKVPQNWYNKDNNKEIQCNLSEKTEYFSMLHQYEKIDEHMTINGNSKTFDLNESTDFNRTPTFKTKGVDFNKTENVPSSLYEEENNVQCDVCDEILQHQYEQINEDDIYEKFISKKNNFDSTSDLKTKFIDYNKRDIIKSYGSNDHLKFFEEKSVRTATNDTFYMEARCFIPTKDCPENLRLLCGHGRTEVHKKPTGPPKRKRRYSDTSKSPLIETFF